MILTDGDKEWLRQTHSGLLYASEEISGTVSFIGTYNEESGRFQVLYEGSQDEVGGLRIAGNFGIRLKSRTDTTWSKLPALDVDGVEASADRHFSQVDHSACLCSPFEEGEFLIGGLAFVPFFEQLVIPFLYGQEFYSRKRHWPWSEYAHGAVGLLEAYAEIRDPSRAEECLNKLMHDKGVWPRIASVLQQRKEIKGHMPCFCPRMDHMRRCHPKALEGIRQLRRDLNVQRQSFARIIGAGPYL